MLFTNHQCTKYTNQTTSHRAYCIYLVLTTFLQCVNISFSQAAKLIVLQAVIFGLSFIAPFVFFFSLTFSHFYSSVHYRFIPLLPSPKYSNAIFTLKGLITRSNVIKSPHEEFMQSLSTISCVLAFIYLVPLKMKLKVGVAKTETVSAYY